MVQVIDIRAQQPRQSFGEGFGAGIGKTLSMMAEVSLQQKISDMMENQKTEKNKEINRQAFGGNDYGGMDPKIAAIVHKMTIQQGDLSTINDALNDFQTGTSSTGSGLAAIRPEADEVAMTRPQTPETYRGLPFELPYEQMPAEEPIVQPRAKEEAKTYVPEKELTPVQKYNQNKSALDNLYKTTLPKIKSPEGKKQFRGYYNDMKKSLQQDRANDIAEAKLGQTKEAFEFTKEQATTQKTKEAEQKRTQDFITQTEGEAREIPLQQNLLNIAKRSIQEGNFGLLSPDQIAEWTKISAFRTPQGEAFRTAVKDYFLTDIKNAGARPNQFIEKMLADILPTVGKSYAANMVWAEMQQMKIDLNKRRSDLIRQLSPKYSDQYGKPTPALIDAVNTEMMDYGDKLQDRTAYRMQEVMEHDATQQEMRSTKKVTEGTPLTASRAKELTTIAGGDRQKAIKAAKMLGYKIIDRNLLNE